MSKAKLFQTLPFCQSKSYLSSYVLLLTDSHNLVTFTLTMYVCTPVVKALNFLHTIFSFFINILKNHVYTYVKYKNNEHM
jgi:hypothetical protein